MKQEDVTARAPDGEQAQGTDAARGSGPEGYVSKAEYEALAGQLRAMQDSAPGDADSLKQQIRQLRKEKEQLEATHKEELMKLKLESALAGAGAKNIKAVMALMELDKIACSESGELEGVKEQLEVLQKAPDSAFLFEAKQGPGQFRMKGVQPARSSDGHKPEEPDSAVSFAKGIAAASRDEGANKANEYYFNND